jgi:hypothetical protein
METTPPMMTITQVQTVADGYNDSYTPTSGQTVSFRNNSDNGTLLISPIALIAALFINLPSDAASRVGQELTVVFSKPVTTVTVQNGTLWGDPGTAALGEAWTIKKVGTSTWAKT